MTPIDTAYDAMDGAPQDDGLRLRFYERLMEAELFLMLKSEADENSIIPDLFEVDELQFALVFDSAERLSDFAEKIVPYAALSGRNIVKMIKDKGIGLGLNLAVAPSSTLLPAEAIEWMASMQTSAQVTQARPTTAYPPANVPEQVITALDTKLAGMAGMADAAYLADIVYEDETRATTLSFVNANVAAQNAIANAIAETVAFSGVEASILDVIFLNSSDSICASLAKLGLRFDLPKAETPNQISIPGSDPNKPPNLR